MSLPKNDDMMGKPMPWIHGVCWCRDSDPENLKMIFRTIEILKQETHNLL